MWVHCKSSRQIDIISAGTLELRVTWVDFSCCVTFHGFFCSSERLPIADLGDRHVIEEREGDMTSISRLLGNAAKKATNKTKPACCQCTYLEAESPAKYQRPFMDRCSRNESWKRRAAPYARMVGRPCSVEENAAKTGERVTDSQRLSSRLAATYRHLHGTGSRSSHDAL